MMKIKLHSMAIRNFKGIQNYEFEPKGKNIAVFGDNGTGKSTLYDAFLWCLFGKNSADQSDDKFDWKPLDEDNNEIHHLETQVVVTLDIDGKLKEFSRTKAENWKKKRGSITETFDGHTTVYAIDGLKVTQRDFKGALDELGGEETFRILTKLNYFPEAMDKNKRRNVLLEMVDDVTKYDVVGVNHMLQPVLELLEDTDAETALKKNKQQRAQINKDIESLPSRIDEVDRSLPDLTELNKDELKREKLALLADVERKQEALIQLDNGFADTKIKTEISELQVHAKEQERIYRERLSQDLDHLYDRKRNLSDDLVYLQGTLRQAQSERDDLQRQINSESVEIERMQAVREQLLKEFEAVKAEQFEAFDEHALTCPTCQREYDEEHRNSIQANYQKQHEAFNLRRADKMKAIREQGKANSEKLEAWAQELGKDQQRLAQANASLDNFIKEKLEPIQKELSEIEVRIQQEQTAQAPFSETEIAKEIQAKIDDLQAKLNSGSAGVEQEKNEIRAQIVELNNKISEVNDKLYQFELHAKQSERKQELIEQEKRLALEYGRLEQEQYLLEEYVRTRVSLLTDAINSKFKLVKFKLFDTQINGGLVEVCEPTVDGKNYSTGLNNAARINAGLDIINTLMTHYGKFVPVFVDNAESVNELLEVDTQVITLSVSKHKKMKVEDK